MDITEITHKNNIIQTKQLIFRNRYAYTCVYILITTTNEKEAMKLREKRWVYRTVSKKGSKWEWYNYLII